MARLSKSELLSRLVQSSEISRMSTHVFRSRHQFSLHLEVTGWMIDVLVYIWNCTHGGYGRADDEYRIQMTGVQTGETGEGYSTVVLGWYEQMSVFVAFDSWKEFHPGSSSLQVRKGAIQETVGS